MLPVKVFRCFSQSPCTSLLQKLRSPVETSLNFARSVSSSRLNVHLLMLENGREVAYQAIPGRREPTVVMIPGLHSYSDMEGYKASCLLRYCDKNDYPCVVYDHECTGKSKGDVKKVLFTSWVEDAIEVVSQCTEGPVVLVGSSLGGWLSLITATKIPDRIHGMVLFAPAINYVWPYYHKYKQVYSLLEDDGPHVHTCEYGEAMLKEDFAEDSRQYEIDLKEKLEITCPVRIIHGLQDTEVDPEQSVKLCKSLASNDVDLIYRKGSDHRLESPPDIELFLITLDRLMKDNPVLLPAKKETNTLLQ